MFCPIPSLTSGSLSSIPLTSSGHCWVKVPGTNVHWRKHAVYSRSRQNTCTMQVTMPMSVIFYIFMSLNSLALQYTLLSMKNMANGDPVDIQREKRWPNQTPAGVKVELQPWQEDSDYSDTEGILPRPPSSVKEVKQNAEATETKTA